MAINLNASGYPSLRGWGEPGRDASQLDRIRLAGSDALPLRVDRRIAPLVQRLVDGLADIRRRHGKPALTSSGGYNRRLISGTDRWSNHSWGLAIDLCAAANPYSRTLQFDFPEAESRALAHSLGFRWGRDYVNQKFDPMHWEFMGSPSDAAALINGLGATSSTAEEDDMFSDDDRKLLVEVLHQLGRNPATGTWDSWPQLDKLSLVDAVADIRHTLKDPITSGVAGSTVKMAPRDTWRNADAYGYQAGQRIAALEATVQSLAAAVASSKGIDAAQLRQTIQDAIAAAVVKVDVSVGQA